MPIIHIPQTWLSPLSRDQQIDELNNEVRCKLVPSTVHGVGVIALRNIQKGAKCYCAPRMIPRFYNVSYNCFNRLFPEIKEIILQRWASVINGSVFRSPNDDAGLLFFINHSTDPNYDVVSDTALRDIKKGEELFEDYRVMDNWEKVRPPEENSWLNCQKSDIIKENKLKSWFLGWFR